MKRSAVEMVQLALALQLACEAEWRNLPVGVAYEPLRPQRKTEPVRVNPRYL